MCVCVCVRKDMVATGKRRKKRKSTGIAKKKRVVSKHRPSISYKKLVLKAMDKGRGAIASSAFPPSLPALHSSSATRRSNGGRGTSRLRSRSASRRRRRQRRTTITTTRKKTKKKKASTSPWLYLRWCVFIYKMLLSLSSMCSIFRMTPTTTTTTTTTYTTDYILPRVFLNILFLALEHFMIFMQRYI